MVAASKKQARDNRCSRRHRRHAAVPWAVLTPAPPADTGNTFLPAEADAGEHQRPPGAGDEERQVHSGLQDVPEDAPLGQG